MSEPMTEAGRALLAIDHEPKGPCHDSPRCDCGRAIARIEREAIDAYLASPEAVDIVARYIGKAGWVRAWEIAKGEATDLLRDLRKGT